MVVTVKRFGVFGFLNYMGIDNTHFNNNQPIDQWPPLSHPLFFFSIFPPLPKGFPSLDEQPVVPDEAIFEEEQTEIKRTKKNYEDEKYTTAFWEGNLGEASCA